MPTLHWIGKDKVINHHQDVPYRILEKQYTYKDGQESDASSENKIIHGDNLEALKSLLPEYEGKVKCIYIDPPYNTGNEGWIYNDNVNDPKLKKWLGQVVGKESEDLSRHDKWLCMMYPRLKLLHKLLAEDGAIFISIDDNEMSSLKLLCDEIFGMRNYLGLITRKQSSGSKNDTGSNKVITTADYILPYKKNTFTFHPYKQKSTKRFNHEDKLGFFSTRALEMQGGGDTLPVRSKMGYSVYYRMSDSDVVLLFDYDLNNDPIYQDPNADLISEGYICYRPRKRGNLNGIWRWGAETFQERFLNNLVHFENGRIFIKERETDFINKYPEALLEDFLNTQGTNELKDIFQGKAFDFPKPSELIKFLVSVSTDQNSLVIDSFAGSGTTAHAVLNLNKEDGGNRKFILIEMEDYAETITAERVKRVITGYGEDKKTVEGTGGDFSYYELGKPVFLDNEMLNEEIGKEKIQEYVWFSETKLPYQSQEENYLLGIKDQTAYYFYYNASGITTLDESFLRTLKTKANQYIIYADNCLLTKELMKKYNIIFKKIPRDITRF